MATPTNQPQLIPETEITAKTSANTISKLSLLPIASEKETTSSSTTTLTPETRTGTFNNVYTDPPLPTINSIPTPTVSETPDLTISNALQTVSDTNKIIIFSTIGGVAFLAFITFLWCICRKKGDDDKVIQKGQRIDWTNPRSPIILSPGMRQRKSRWKFWKRED